MGKIWILTIALVIFLAINFIYSRALKGYVKKKFGEKWLTTWGNKVFYWQSSIFVSTAGTVLLMYFLKWIKGMIF